MAKLNQTQRNVIVEELTHAAPELINNKYKKQKDLLKEFGSCSVQRDYNTGGAPQVRLSYGRKSILSENTCVPEEQLKILAEDSVSQPSREWFQKQLDEGNYTLEYKFTECMDYPTSKIEFESYDAEMKRLKSAKKRGVLKRYHKACEIRDEMKADVLATNKFMAKMYRKIMLGSSDAEQMLTKTIDGLKEQLL